MTETTDAIQYHRDTDTAGPLAPADSRLEIPAAERVLIIRASYTGRPADRHKPVQRIDLHLDQFPVTAPVQHTQHQLVYRLGAVSQEQAEQIMEQLAGSGLLPAAFEPEVTAPKMTLAPVRDASAVDVLVRNLTETTDYGTLTDYRTGEPIRPATADEHAQSLASGYDGAFTDDDGRTVFVAGGPES